MGFIKTRTKHSVAFLNIPAKSGFSSIIERFLWTLAGERSPAWVHTNCAMSLLLPLSSTAYDCCFRGVTGLLGRVGIWQPIV